MTNVPAAPVPGETPKAAPAVRAAAPLRRGAPLETVVRERAASMLEPAVRAARVELAALAALAALAVPESAD